MRGGKWTLLFNEAANRLSHSMWAKTKNWHTESFDPNGSDGLDCNKPGSPSSVTDSAVYEVWSSLPFTEHANVSYGCWNRTIVIGTNRPPSIEQAHAKKLVGWVFACLPVCLSACLFACLCVLLAL